LRIAYIGPEFGTSLHRARALERLGHDVTIIDVREKLGRSYPINAWLWHTSGFGLQTLFLGWLRQRLRAIRPDVTWINQEPFIGRKCLREIRQFSGAIVGYLNDDPFSTNRAAKRLFRNYRSALPVYDLIAVVRDVNVDELRNAGAPKVMRIYMSADEIAHRPRPLSDSDKKRFASEVAFIGTWMPERGPFMAKLIRAGVPITIWGDRWEKAEEWPTLKQYWRGPGLYHPDDYAKAIQCAKVCLCLLSKDNRDLHTRRSIEIPALGGLLCAERTMEHEALYIAGEEAVFWDGADDCADKCLSLLENDRLREKIAKAGHERCLKNGHFNEQLLQSIISQLEKKA